MTWRKLLSLPPSSSWRLEIVTGGTKAAARGRPLGASFVFSWAFRYAISFKPFYFIGTSTERSEGDILVLWGGDGERSLAKTRSCGPLLRWSRPEAVCSVTQALYVVKVSDDVGPRLYTTYADCPPIPIRFATAVNDANAAWLTQRKRSARAAFAGSGCLRRRLANDYNM
jgi:hypothetical protein